MKNLFIIAIVAVFAFTIAVAPAHAQTTQTEIQADLLRLQIIATLKAKNYAGAAKLFDQYDALDVAMPPPLQLQRAVAYFRLKRYEDTENELRAYLERAERGSDGYNQAIIMLAEVTPLVAPARERQVAAICKGKGADYVGSSLHEAAKENACISAASLIQRGADVNAKDDDGKTPLHHAVHENPGGETETAALLIKHGADVNAKDNDGVTPLFEAHHNHAIETVALLIEHGAGVKAKNNEGETPLHWVAWENATETAALLIQHGADVKAKNNNGDTPLHWAAWYNATENAVLLIQHGADVKAKNNEGKTPLRLMATNEKRDRNEVKAMKKLFREYGRK